MDAPSDHPPTLNLERVVAIPQQRLSHLVAVYAFGSRVQGAARPDGDLDLAVPVAGHADPLVLFDLAGEVADVAGCPVDLLDLRNGVLASLGDIELVLDFDAARSVVKVEFGGTFAGDDIALAS